MVKKRIESNNVNDSPFYEDCFSFLRECGPFGKMSSVFSCEMHASGSFVHLKSALLKHSARKASNQMNYWVSKEVSKAHSINLMIK